MGETTVNKGVIKGAVTGWVKAVVMGVLGLSSGAVIMYLTPLVDKVNPFKPAKPLANFGIQVDGTKVTFVNQAEGSEGWWDFGDGTPLQPFTPDQKTVTHDYPRKGSFTAKLTLRNLIREEDHREVNVQIDGTVAQPPSIDVFDVKSLEMKPFAPATFKVTTQIKGADLYILALSAEHPLEVVPDPPAAQERYVTFVNPGKYTAKLAIAKGDQIIEKTQNIEVLPAPYAAPLAVVQVKHQVSWAKSHQRDQWVKVSLPDKAQGALVPFTQDIMPDHGCQIATATFSPQMKLPAFIQNPKLAPAAGGTKAILTGEFLPAKVAKGQAPAWVVPVQLNEQTGSSKPMANKVSDPVVMRFDPDQPNFIIPLPKMSTGWKSHKHDITLELYDGATLVWKDKNNKLPNNAPLSFYNKNYLVTATEVNGNLRLEMKKNNSPPTVPLFGQ